jgi:hypothetical protein
VSLVQALTATTLKLLTITLIDVFPIKELVTFDGCILSSKFPLTSIPIFFNCLPFLFSFFSSHFLNFHLPYNICVIFVLLFPLLFWETFKTSLIPSGDHGMVEIYRRLSNDLSKSVHFFQVLAYVWWFLGAGGQWDK